MKYGAEVTDLGGDRLKIDFRTKDGQELSARVEGKPITEQPDDIVLGTRRFALGQVMDGHAMEPVNLNSSRRAEIREILEELYSEVADEDQDEF